MKKKLEENKNNIKQTWKYLNAIINKKANNSESNYIFTHEKQITDPVEIANSFAITSEIQDQTLKNK